MLSDNIQSGHFQNVETYESLFVFHRGVFVQASHFMLTALRSANPMKKLIVASAILLPHPPIHLSTLPPILQ